MRIALWHNLPSGGGKRALYEQACGLIARGHTVETWCPATNEEPYLPLDELGPVHRLPLPPMPTPRRRILFNRVRRDFRLIVDEIAILEQHAETAADEINKTQPDVVLVSSSRFVNVPAVGRHLKRPFVLYLGEPSRVLYEARPRLPWPAIDPPVRSRWAPGYLRWFVEDLIDVQKYREWARIEQLNMSAYPEVLVNSRFTRESVLRIFGRDAQVCRLGVDFRKFRPTGEPRENFIVGLGEVQINKGVDRAVAAMATIPERTRPPLVWIANRIDPSYRAEVEAVSRETGVRLDIKLMIPDDQLVSLLSRAAVMVYTSRLEPFGFAPLEANACETPVVAIAEGGVRETVVHGVNGLLVDDAAPATLGAAIQEVLDDAGLGRRLGEAGREAVIRRWSWDGACERLDEFLCHEVRRSSAGENLGRVQ